MADSKPKGWFSRKHEGSSAHAAAVARYETMHGPESRRRKAKEREVARAGRTPQDQLAILDQRPGESRRERDRLQKRITETEKPDIREERDVVSDVHAAASSDIVKIMGQHAAEEKKTGRVRSRHTCGGKASLGCPRCQEDLEIYSEHP